jgi:uncharacterized membrane protein
MSAPVVIASLWLLFAATHMGLSSLRLRPRLVTALGEQPFLGAYSLIALAVFTALFWFYIVHRHQGAELWALPLGNAGLAAIYVLQAVAWTLVAAGLVQPSPAVVGLPEERRPSQPRGVQLLTRHPVFMGLGLFGLLHVLVNGFASDAVFWAGFPIFALIGSAHQDRRKLVTQGAAYRAWCAATPFLPFSGRDTARALRELGVLPVAVGIALAVVFRLLHGPLFH